MTRLAERLQAEIAAEGPMTAADYMARCLWDPQDGYYATRPAVGAGGDFVTAPTVSQMFGELLGLWAAQAWADLGGPPARLVEIGPGDGSLMRDALRAVRRAPGFLDAVEVVLVEPSTPLRARQAERLAGADVRWAEGLEAVGTDRPLLLIANEVLDCLPVRQFLRTEEGWVERRIGLDEAGGLAFVGYPAPAGFAPPVDVAPGQVVEVSPAQEAFAARLGALVAEAGGAALLVDYGRGRPEAGDTLQALRGHVKVDPLAAPGESDLTVWADFPAVLAAARAAGAAVAGPLPQGELLRRLGVETRAAALARAEPTLAPVLRRQLERLTAPDAMGELFKAVCLFQRGAPPPPGFADVVLP